MIITEKLIVIIHQRIFKMSSIFVSICAYNENYIEFTVSDLISKLSNKNNITVGIIEQSSINKFAKLDKYKNVIHLKQNVLHRTGVGRQRLIALNLNTGSDYVLQIDAHSTFSQDWDIELINRLEELQFLHKTQCLISQHLPVCVDKGAGILERIDNINNYTQMYGMTLFEERISLYPVETKNWWYENYFLTAHYIFSTPSVFKEVMPDPDIFFWGEEHSTSLRMWSRNIKIFSTDYIGIGHLDKGNPLFIDSQKIDWKNQILPIEQKNLIASMDRASILKMYDILKGNIVGYWGAPDSSKAQEFIEKSGTDLEKLCKFWI